MDKIKSANSWQAIHDCHDLDGLNTSEEVLQAIMKKWDQSMEFMGRAELMHEGLLAYAVWSSPTEDDQTRIKQVLQDAGVDLDDMLWGDDSL